MHDRLFPRYWLVIAGLVTALLVAGGAVEMFFAYRENVARIQAIQQAEVRLVAGRIVQALDDLGRSVRETANLPWHERLLGVEDARQELHRLLKVAKPIYEVRGYAATGGLLVSASRIQLDRATRGEAPPDSPDLHKYEAGYRPIIYRNGSEPYTTLVVPVATPGPLFAVFEADINLKFVSDVINEASTTEGRNVYVVDGRGNLIAHSDAKLPLRRLNFESLSHVAALRSMPPLHEARSQRSQDFFGRSVVVSGMPVSTAGWAAFVEEPVERAHEGAWSTARRTAFLVAAGLLAAVAASFVLARRLSKPIIELQQGADRLARGDFAGRIEVKTGDEIESLADKFNAMATQLRDYTTGLERKVEEKTASLQEAMRSRELFLAAASHDLRQPLYAISILADALALKQIPSDAQEVLGKQRQAIAILRTLFDNLLDLSRFEAGEVRPSLRAMPLREILSPIAVEYEVLADAKGLEWRCSLEDHWVETDPELLRRLVGNLLSNAVRYTTSGWVALDAAAHGDRVQITVSDTGVGIAEQDQVRVFKEFVQLENPSRDRDRGVGLGLSIVKKIDLLLGTRLEMRSAPGMGTTLRLELPRVEAIRSPEREEAVVGFVPILPGCRIWVVEDDLMVRSALAMQFDEWAIDHDFAVTRAEVEELRRSDGDWPDAVLLDDMLGRAESGLELADWLAPHVGRDRVILVTGNVNPVRADELRASGFKVLRKPIASAVLAQALNEALRSPRSGQARAPAG